MCPAAPHWRIAEVWECPGDAPDLLPTRMLCLRLLRGGGEHRAALRWSGETLGEQWGGLVWSVPQQDVGGGSVAAGTIFG